MTQQELDAVIQHEDERTEAAQWGVMAEQVQA